LSAPAGAAVANQAGQPVVIEDLATPEVGPDEGSSGRRQVGFVNVRRKILGGNARKLYRI